MARIGDKWSTLAIVALSSGAKRFGELRRKLEGISQKMLTQTLRNLERDGLVLRTLYDERPLRVEYELTALGHTLIPHLVALKEWSERNWKAVERAQADFDQIHQK